MNRWSRWSAVGALMVLGLVGCGDDRPGPVLPPLPSSASPSASSTSASPSPSVRPTGTAEEQVLAQYRRFWTEMYSGVEAVPSRDRDAFLRPVVTQPLLSELLRIASQRDRAGTQLRGTPAVIDPVVTRQGGSAVVSDCVDLTNVVLVNRSTGDVVGGEGTDRRAIDTYLRRGADGVWRVHSLNDVKDYEC